MNEIAEVMELKSKVRGLEAENLRLKEKLVMKGKGIVSLDADNPYALFEDRDDIAAGTGMKVRYPSSNELFIDVDSDEQMGEMYERFNLIGSLMTYFTPSIGFELTSIRPSKSGLPHRHVVITADRNLTEEEALLYQAFFCSDPARELYGLLRLLFTGESMNCFFEKTSAIEG